jgi:hypothetical protein
MECAVYDTYVTKKDGRTMHFDVVVDADTPTRRQLSMAKNTFPRQAKADRK